MISVLLFAYSCKKEAVNNIKTKSQTEQTVDKAIAPWILIVIAEIVVEVVGELSSGQYEGDKVVGDKIVNGGCGGLGNCVFPHKINNAGGNGDGQGLSSEDNEVEAQFTQTINGQFMKLNDGRIAYTISPSEEGCETFFYSDTINLSKPYTIDNPVFFELMNLDISISPIVIAGDYIVETDRNGQKFIIVYK